MAGGCARPCEQCAALHGAGAERAGPAGAEVGTYVAATAIAGRPVAVIAGLSPTGTRRLVVVDLTTVRQARARWAGSICRPACWTAAAAPDSC